MVNGLLALSKPVSMSTAAVEAALFWLSLRFALRASAAILDGSLRNTTITEMLSADAYSLATPASFCATLETFSEKKRCSSNYNILFLVIIQSILQIFTFPLTFNLLLHQTINFDRIIDSFAIFSYFYLLKYFLFQVAYIRNSCFLLNVLTMQNSITISSFQNDPILKSLPEFIIKIIII